MIAYMNPLLGDEFCAYAEAEPIVGSKIITLYKCYGNHLPFCDFYLIYRDGKREHIQGAICRYHGSISIVCSDNSTNMEELAEFIVALGALELECKSDLYEKLAPHIQVSVAENSVVLSTKIAQELPSEGVVSDLNLMALHGLLCSCFEGFSDLMPFSNWYVDTSARVRRGGCAVFGIVEDEKIVSTAGIYSICNGAGVIASVATLPERRKMGHARRCIFACLNQLSAEGKATYIIASEEGLVKFYEKMGFERTAVRTLARLTPTE